MTSCYSAINIQNSWIQWACWRKRADCIAPAGEYVQGTLEKVAYQIMGALMADHELFDSAPASKATNINSVIADLGVLQVKEPDFFSCLSCFDQRTLQYSGFCSIWIPLWSCWYSRKHLQGLPKHYLTLT